jgi:hypothetical protein
MEDSGSSPQQVTTAEDDSNYKKGIVNANKALTEDILLL